MKRRLTVIDDDTDLRNLLQISLRLEGFEVQAFSNGNEFIASMKITQQAELFVIDINLGGLTGFEICSYIKANPETTNAIVILISANPEVSQIAKDVCADDFMQKPFSQRELIEKIKGFLKI
jgi:two-component system, OmpR family, phosphate regulon response regulator PhoB